MKNLIMVGLQDELSVFDFGTPNQYKLLTALIDFMCDTHAEGAEHPWSCGRTNC